MIQNFWLCWMITSPGGPVGSYINALLKKRLWFKAGFIWGEGGIKEKVFKVPLQRWCKTLEHDVTAAIHWCLKTMKQQPCWSSKQILWELNSFLT